MEITLYALGEFILHHVSEFGYYIIYVITIIYCCVIINSFGILLSGFPARNRDFSDVFT